MNREDHDFSLRDDEGNVWATSDNRGRRRLSKKARSQHLDLKKQSSYKTASVSERIKNFESQEKKLISMEKPKDKIVSVNEYKKRLKDKEGNKYAVDGQKGTKPEKINMDILSIRQKIREKEERVSHSANNEPRRMLEKTPSARIIPFSNDMMYPNIHERKTPPLPNHSTDTSIRKSIIPFSKEEVNVNISEKKSMKDMTRKLIRKLSMERILNQHHQHHQHHHPQQHRNEQPIESIPDKAMLARSPSRIEKEDLQQNENEICDISLPLPPQSSVQISISPPPVPESTISHSLPESSAVADSDKDVRSTREKNNSFFRKRQKSNAEKLLAEQDRINNMKPEEREKFLEEKKELEKHEQRKSDHYAKLGKAFVVKEAGSGRPSGSKRGGRGGRGTKNR